MNAYHPRAVVRIDELIGMLENGVRVLAVCRHHARRKLRALPEIVEVGFCDRNIEAVVEPLLETLHDAALLFQGLGAEDLEFPTDYADDHGRAIAPGTRSGL